MVIWTPQAKIDLQSIHSYIAKDSPINAKKVVTHIINETEYLLSLPADSLGKKVIEIGREDIREIHIHSWRVIYLAAPAKKHVLTVFHFRRELGPENIKN